MIHVPIGRLRTTLAPLRGEHTDRGELATMPLRVAATDDGAYEVLDGFKRLARWRGEGRCEIPVVVESVTGPAMKARLLDANALPKTSSPMDEARVVAALAGEDGFSTAAIAKLLGRKPQWVERRLTLGRRLAKDLGSRVDRGRLSLTLGVALCAFAQGEQIRLAGAIERHSLTTRETEALLATYRGADGATREALLRDPRSAQPRGSEQGASPLGRSAAQIAARFDDVDRVLDELTSADFSGLADAERRILQARRRQLMTRLQHFKEASDGPRHPSGDPGPRPAGAIDPRDRQEARLRPQDGPQSCRPGAVAPCAVQAGAVQGQGPRAPLAGPDRAPDPARDPRGWLHGRPDDPGPVPDTAPRSQASAATCMSTTTASRSWPSCSDVRSVDSTSGNIGNTPAAVYTEVVLTAAWPSTAPPGRTSASTSATATISRVTPPAIGSATLSWSRSRVSSLSMENQVRWRRSRMVLLLSRSVWREASASCKACVAKVGSRPRERMASTAIWCRWVGSMGCR